ncbi:NB-ARC domain disease resistance protein [Medicago truncatula]|uniref:NB-ARC domain disease resistance protein n=1 Tax=Medicago truncatula TaxID=3880 RepID=G7L6X2_MEDTR|nr:NB-ARC domain disease resistance protein [Medicago truncatula]
MSQICTKQSICFLREVAGSKSEIKAAVLDAEEQQQGPNNYRIKLWVEKLKDTLDDRQVLTKDKKAKKVRIFLSSSNQLLFSFNMAQKIKKLRKRIEGLNVDRKIFNFTNHTPEKRVMRQRVTHSFIREEKVIGRDDEKKDLIKLLLNTDIDDLERPHCSTCVHDKTVQQHFELKKWVCVADDDSEVKGFDVEGIAAKILESKTRDEMDQVQQELRTKIDGNRYLLILDDMWNEERENWLQLMTLLRDGAKGSKIVITTRSETVAKISGTSSLFSLKGLDEKQSWNLFSQLAFENRKESENPIWVSIGKEISKKCSGVPLAHKSIGSLMFSMETEKDWLNFKNKDLIKIDEQGGNKIFQLIKLSYDHLPFYLKKCFAFCSLFPKDYRIEKKKLIRLWIAQGLVHSSDESTNLEDNGDKYFLTLLHRSIFQVNEKEQHIEKGTRHVSFGFALDISWQVPSSLLEAKKLRTFLLPQRCNAHFFDVQASMEESASNSIISSFKQFRVLNLNHIITKKIPSCIGMLKYLRYLDLSHNEQIEVLPNSITKLINLETLLLNDCF